MARFPSDPFEYNPQSEGERAPGLVQEYRGRARASSSGGYPRGATSRPSAYKSRYIPARGYYTSRPPAYGDGYTPRQGTPGRGAAGGPVRSPWPHRYPDPGWRPWIGWPPDAVYLPAGLPAAPRRMRSVEYIRWVQSALNQALGLQLPVDGVMNQATRNALRDFQRRQGLPATGYVGPDTQQALIEARRSTAAHGGSAYADGASATPGDGTPPPRRDNARRGGGAGQPTSSPPPQSELFETGGWGRTGAADAGMWNAVCRRQESLAVQTAIRQGQRDPNKLTNLVFCQRHPELGGRKLRPAEAVLVGEWKAILRDIVLPQLRSSGTGPAAATSIGARAGGETLRIAATTDGIQREVEHRPPRSNPSRRRAQRTRTVTEGEFGRTLSRLDIPQEVVDLLKSSQMFMKMAVTLDKRYVSIWDHKREIHIWRDISPDGVVEAGQFKGRRVLDVKPSAAGSRFEPYTSPDSEGYYDAIWIKKPYEADTLRWIEVIAHETGHAFNLVTRTSPPAAKMADRIRAAIAEEIATRKIEALVVSEIMNTKRGRERLEGQTPHNGGTDPHKVERDFFPTSLERTYLEHFVLHHLMDEAIKREGLSENEIKAKNQEIDRIPIDGWRSRKFSSDYSKFRFWLRVIDFRWRRLRQLHHPETPEFERVKEQVLQENANAFFGGLVRYTPRP